MTPLDLLSAAKGALRPSVALCLLASSGCGAAVVNSRIEDKARRDVPIAICRKPLTAQDVFDNGALHPEAYWSAIFTGFHGFGAPLDSSVRNCVGETPFASDAQSAPSPLTLTPNQATIGGGEDGLQAVWLRAAPPSDHVTTGALALVRVRPTELNVYALGAYRGSALHTRFGFAKLGALPALIAWSDACADGAAGLECENTLAVYVTNGGQLVPTGKATTERVGFGTMKDVGRVKWRLTTEPPMFDAKGMRIKEKLTARDAREDEVRKLEGQRVYVLKNGELVPTGESLWAQVDKQ